MPPSAGATVPSGVAVDALSTRVVVVVDVTVDADDEVDSDADAAAVATGADVVAIVAAVAVPDVDDFCAASFAVPTAISMG